MHCYKHIVFFVLLCMGNDLIKCVRGTEKEKNKKVENEDIFKPTSEWQPLRKDQVVPSGLHIRVNIVSGEREAKLLDPNDEPDADSRRLTEVRVEEGDGSVTADDENIRETLEKLLPNDPLSKEELREVLARMDDGFEHIATKEDIERVNRKFRSYAELKKEMGDLKLKMRTDSELMGQLLEEYKELKNHRSGGSEEKKLLDQEEQLLNELEYLLHQVDNAVDFVKANGFKEVVFTSLNSTSWKVRYEATKVLGSAVQNNPKAKIGALEAGAIPVFLRILALDSNSKVKSGALYGIACMIRRFPLAQSHFLDKGGLNVLIKLFNSETSDLLKIQIKAVALIRDLIDELREAESRSEAADSTVEGKEVKERAKQLKLLKLSDRLSEEGWCEALVKALRRQVTSSDPNTVEVLAEGMLSAADVCLPVFSVEAGQILDSLDAEYRLLIGRDDHDYLWTHSLLIKLKQLIARQHKKDEL